MSNSVRSNLSSLGMSRLEGAELALGRLSGYSDFGKFGFNPGIGTSEEDVWDIGGDYPGELSSAETFDVRSSSASDTSATIGTGAKTVTVYGVDGSYALQSETVSMNGTSNVTTSNSYVMIYRMIVVTAGSNNGAVGNIQATPSTTGTARAQITAGYDQTLMAVFMVPAGRTLVIDGLYWGADKPGGAIDVNPRLLVKPFGGVYSTKRLIGGRSTGATPFYLPVRQVCAEEKSMVKVRASASAASTRIYAGFDGVLAEV